MLFWFLQLKLSGSAFLYICEISSPFHIQPDKPRLFWSEASFTHGWQRRLELNYKFAWCLCHVTFWLWSKLSQNKMLSIFLVFVLENQEAYSFHSTFSTGTCQNCEMPTVNLRLPTTAVPSSSFHGCFLLALCVRYFEQNVPYGSGNAIPCSACTSP